MMNLQKLARNTSYKYLKYLNAHTNGIYNPIENHQLQLIDMAIKV